MSAGETGSLKAWSDDFKAYFTRPLLTVLFLGFSSGLPLALTGATLSYWLADANVNRTAIGLFGVVATPYALKFLWAPLIDNAPVPGLTRALGRRRGWMLLTQLMLLIALSLLGGSPPDIDPWKTALAAFFVAFASASQDIVIDAYRVERLTPREQGQGAAMAQLGYQLGMIAAGAGALKLAGPFGWQETYFIMAALLGVGIVTTLLAREPDAPVDFRKARPLKERIRESILEPFMNFLQHRHWLMILSFVVLFKLADAFIGRMTSPFFHDLQFSKDDIANIVKIYGTVATLLGIFLGGSLTRRFGTLKVLFAAGALHALTNLLYLEQARLGADANFLAVSISVENFTNGISSAAFVAYLSNLCNRHYTGTQYALLSSLAALARTWLAAPAGWVQSTLGWQWFFGLSSLLALPGLLLLLVLNKRLSTAVEFGPDLQSRGRLGRSRSS